VSRWVVIGLRLLAWDEPASRAPATPPEPAVDPGLEARFEEAEAEISEAPPSAWPDEVRSLRETVESFESIDACLTSLRARTPTEIAEAVNDLARTFVRDLERIDPSCLEP